MKTFTLIVVYLAMMSSASMVGHYCHLHNWPLVVAFSIYTACCAFAGIAISEEGNA